MSVESGFFNSVNGDRTYNADNISNFFSGILNDGVFKNYDNEMAVSAGSDFSVNVAGGKAMNLGKYILNTGQLNLILSGAGILPRYDAVVVGVNLEDRTADIYIKQGTPSAIPLYPAILDNDTTKELCLAYIYVAAGATTITSENITDTRSDNAVCGFVSITNISPSLSILKNNITLKEKNVESVAIGIAEFNTSTDAAFVYLNGILMLENVEYTIKGTGSSATIELENKIINQTLDNVITVIIHKIII